MVKKTTSCFNCEYHRERADNFEKIILSMIKKISKSDLIDILLKKKILNKDYLSGEITLKDKCKCGKNAIGYTGLKGEKQFAVCQKCFDSLNKSSSNHRKSTK